MNNTPSQVISALLIDEGMFEDPEDSDPSWPLYITAEPAEPAQVATLYDTTPVVDGYLQKTRQIMQHYGIQLRIRSQDFLTGWVMASESLDTIVALKNESITVGGKTYTIPAIVATTGVITLGPDEKRRDIFTVNFLTSIKEN